MTKRLVDRHEFILWRYEDDSIDVQYARDGGMTQPEVAAIEACVLARTLTEELRESEEVFSLRAYQNGGATTQWRGEDGSMTSRARFLWMKSILQQATYGSLVLLEEPPLFAARVLWRLEYALARLASLWAAFRAGAKSSPVELEQTQAEEEQTPLPENVVPFRRR